MKEFDKSYKIKDRYVLEEKLGAGNFGETWKAHDELLDQSVAIKIFYNSDPSRKEKYIKEARTLAGLRDIDGVVSVIDFFEVDGHFCLVMECLRGQSLVKCIETNGVMSYTEAIKLLEPVIHALDSMHAQGVIHRDVSPDNIFILFNGKSKLLDFGSALGVEATDGTLTVKPGFAPAEQYRDINEIGPWTDIYGISASIYYVITGKIPQDGLHREIKDDLKNPSELNANITAAQEECLLKGMAVKAADRHKSCAALLNTTDQKKVTNIASPVNSVKSFNNKSNTENNSENIKQPKENQNYNKKEKKPVSDSSGKNNVEDYEAATAEYKPNIADKEDSFDDVPVPAKKNIFSRFFSQKKYIVISIAALACVIAGVAFFVNSISIGSNPYDKGYGGNSEISEKVVTEKDIDMVANDSNCKQLVIKKAELSNNVIKKISEMNNITELEINQCQGFDSLAPLSNMKKIKKFNFYKQDCVKDPSFLSGMKNLESIQIENLDFTLCDQDYLLSSLPNLYYVNISGCKMQSVNWTCNLDKLTTIKLPYNEISDASNIRANKVQAIDLSYNKLTGDSKIPQFPDVTNVNISHNQITNLNFLSTNIKLKNINAGTNSISDVSILGQIASLENIQLNDNKIVDISPLTKLSNDIKYLNICNNQINSVSCLSSCAKMTHLGIAGNQITALTGLENMSKLEVLFASNNNISNIADIPQNCPSLNEIDLAHNCITDASPLAGTLSSSEKKRYIDFIMLEHNKIDNISWIPESSTITINTLSIFDNLITDISVIGNKKSTVYDFYITYIDQFSQLDFNAFLGSKKPISYLTIADAPIAAQSEISKKTNTSPFIKFKSSTDIEKDMNDKRVSIANKIQGY